MSEPETNAESEATPAKHGAVEPPSEPSSVETESLADHLEKMGSLELARFVRERVRSLSRRASGRHERVRAIGSRSGMYEFVEVSE